jgi:hypothetical protein
MLKRACLRSVRAASDVSTWSARAVKDALPLLGASETVLEVKVTGERRLS